MNIEQANRLVASSISEAMTHCKNKAVDEQTLRTGLLTITIANFVNRIGKGNAINLFAAIPDQIRSGTFDKYIDPATDTSRQITPSTGDQTLTQSYNSAVMPQNFIPPQTQISSSPDHPIPTAHNTHPTPTDRSGRRRLQQ